jgi:two-component system chemotaxis sensor kinase CheA
LVRLLDGDITVTSEITHGSTFTVYVPARYPPATTSSDRTFTRRGTSPTQVNGTDPAISPRTARSDAVTAGRPSAVHTEPRGTKVLVVDDDMCNIFALIALLERSAAQVVHAQSGFRGPGNSGAAPRLHRGADGYRDADHGRVRDDPGRHSEIWAFLRLTDRRGDR